MIYQSTHSLSHSLPNTTHTLQPIILGLEAMMEFHRCLNLEPSSIPGTLHFPFTCSTSFLLLLLLILPISSFFPPLSLTLSSNPYCSFLLSPFSSSSLASLPFLFFKSLSPSSLHFLPLSPSLLLSLFLTHIFDL